MWNRTPFFQIRDGSGSADVESRPVFHLRDRLARPMWNRTPFFHFRDRLARPMWNGVPFSTSAAATAATTKTPLPGNRLRILNPAPVAAK